MRLIDANEEAAWAAENIPEPHSSVVIQFLRDCGTIDPETLPTVQELREKLERVTAEKNAAINDLLQVGRGYDFCTVCAHCCEGGKPKYRPQEPYMEFCKKCNDDYSQFEWRDSWDGKNGK